MAKAKAKSTSPEVPKVFGGGMVDPSEAGKLGVSVREANRAAAREEAAKVDAPDGLTDAERMRKVFGQGSLADKTNKERVLREWLVKDSKGYLDRLMVLEREAAERVAAAAEKPVVEAETETVEKLRLLGESILERLGVSDVH